MTQDDELSSTDNDWIYLPTPPRFPLLELPVTCQLEDLCTDDSPPPGLIENTTDDPENIQIEILTAENYQMDNDQPSPLAIKYLNDETLVGDSTDEIVHSTLAPGYATINTTSPPPLQLAMSSNISSTPTSDRHLSPRDDSPPGAPEEPPPEAFDDLSNVGYCPNPYAVLVNISNHCMTRPHSYYQRLHDVTL